MDALPSSSSLQPQHGNNCLSDHDLDHRDGEGVVVVDSNNHCSHPMVQNYPPGPIDSELQRSTRCKKRTLMKKRVALDNSESPSSSSSRQSSSAVSSQRGIAVACHRRNPRVLVRRNRGDVAAIGFPIGMSFAAVIAQVLYRRDRTAERMSPEHFSLMCKSAVRESLANVFGDRLDGLTRNFEQSFDSTLNTLRLIYESTTGNKGNEFDTSRREILASELTLDEGDCKRDVVQEDAFSEVVVYDGIQDRSNSSEEEVKESIPMGLVSHRLIVPGQLNQVARFPPISSGANISYFEKSVIEQNRSNDLKAVELGLVMKKLKLKETQLALSSDSNHLERSKLAMGVSKHSFKAEKFKNQQEDLRHGELNKRCIDCLIAGLLVMSSSLLYGAYTYSYQRIAEATASCTPLDEELYSYSWWTPKSVSSFNSRMNVLWCQVQVLSRMAFGFLMICAVAYLLMWRSTTSTTQTMPVTFILLLLGVVCGYFGKLCVDTFGGNGYVWLLYWEIMCFLHFLSIVFTSALFQILHGPVTTTTLQTTKGDTKFPYWFRRFLFYASLLVFLPLFCGLLPFAGLGLWKDHFLMKGTEYFWPDSELN